MTNFEAMLAECLDEVEEVLRGYRYRWLRDPDITWASSASHAFRLDDCLITLHLTVDVSRPDPVEPKTDDDP